MGFLRQYIHYLRPHGFRVLLMFLSGLLFVAFSGVSIWLAADFVQALFTGNAQVPPLPEGGVTFFNLPEVLKHHSARLVIAESPTATLRRAILFIVVAFAVKNIALYVQTVLAAVVEQRIAKRMRDDLYDHLLAQDLAFFHRRGAGDLVSTTVNDITQLNAGLTEGFSKLIRDPLTILMFLVMLVAISWKLTLATALIAPLSGLVMSVMGVSLKRKARRAQDRLGAVTTRLSETLYGMRVVQAYGGEEWEEKRFETATENHFQQALGRERLRRMIAPMQEVVGVIVFAAILIVAGGRVLGGQWLAPDEFVRYLLLLFGMLTPLVSLGEVQARLKAAEGASQRVFELLATEHSIEEATGARSVTGFQQEIVLQGVALAYDDTRAAALEEVDLTVQRGEKLYLVGRSGSGKSSLLNLLPRFYDPSEGRISLDGHDLRELKLEQLRRLFGIVTQDVVLFHDTVAANIAYGGRDVSEERIRQVAHLAGAAGFIEELPQQYQTDLGDLGGRLSGGQRQRISIARALLNDPPILLLDEPTSSLDADVAREVERTLKEVSEGRTVITATHLLTSLEQRDRVVYFEGGRIVADSTHGELLAGLPAYRELALGKRQKGA